MHILYICRSFHNVAGGIEYSSTVFMNEMIRRGHDVSLITWDHEDAVAFFEMDPKIQWLKLNLGDPWKKASPLLKLKRVLKMRKLIKQIDPDVAIGFHDDCYVMGLLASIGLTMPIIAAERNPPSRFNFSLKGTKSAILNNLFRGARFVTVFFDRYHPLYPKYLRDKLVTIPNMIYPSEKPAKAEGGNDNSKKLLFVGRLEYQKNPIVLLKAFAKIAHEFPEWELLLVGEGRDRKELEQYIEENNLSDQVTLTGAVKNIKDYYQSAQLFCFPSRWEGFGNALAEALGNGLPCVGFAECCGVRDLIQHGKSGLLAEGMDNVDTLSDALKTLMKDDALRKDMGKAAYESAKRYTPEIVFDTWETTFQKAVQH